MIAPDLTALALYPLIDEQESIASRSLDTMQEISRRIEDGIVEAGEPAVFFASFQQLSRFGDQVVRYRRLAAHCRQIYVFGIPDWTPPAIEHVVYVPLSAESGLAREWFLVYDAPGYYTALVAQDLTGLHVPRQERVFRGAWTFQGDLVAALRQALEGALGLPPCAGPPRDPAREQQRMAQMIGAVVGRLEERHGELRQAYAQVQQTNEENARLQAIVRRYVAGSAWEEAEKRSREGEKAPSQIRQVTVMFTDIVEFTAFSEQHRPQEVVLALNGYFWWVSRAIAQHQGEINKYTGDGVLAVFADEASAVAAACEILARLAEWNAQRTALGRCPLQTRIGINCGRAIIGTIGGPDRQDRTVLGDVVNTAARLQTLARHDSIVVSAEVYRRAGAPAGFMPRGTVAVRGKAEPISMYEYGA